MTSIILTSKNANKDELAKQALVIKESGQAELILIADSSMDNSENISALIPNDNSQYGQSVQAALHQATSENIILINASANFSSAEIAKLANAAELINDQELAFMSIDPDMISEDLSALDAESILNMVVMKSSTNIAAMVCKKTIIQSVINDETESFEELSLRAIAKSVSSGTELISLGQMPMDAMQAVEASNAANARSLAFLVNCFAIEDLFMQLAWKEHSETSAATAYHTLAAYFLKFEDYSSAAECVSLSEQFQESPRSLALKALIAFNKGETLGAVANLVSSLQQYEERKKSLSESIEFPEKNIEAINTSLVSGLEALNRRDNEKALDHFAKAVFDFDGFYAKHGIDSILH